MINRETDSDRYRKTSHIYKSQLKRLDEMHRLARPMPIRVPQAAPLLQLFRIVQKMQEHKCYGKNIHAGTVDRLMERLEQSFAEMELPKSREEFISRASLFHFFHEIQLYYNRMKNMPPAVISGEHQG